MARPAAGPTGQLVLLSQLTRTLTQSSMGGIVHPASMEAPANMASGPMLVNDSLEPHMMRTTRTTLSKAACAPVARCREWLSTSTGFPVLLLEVRMLTTGLVVGLLLRILLLLSSPPFATTRLLLLDVLLRDLSPPRLRVGVSRRSDPLRGHLHVDEPGLELAQVVDDV